MKNKNKFWQGYMYNARHLKHHVLYINVYVMFIPVLLVVIARYLTSNKNDVLLITVKQSKMQMFCFILQFVFMSFSL